MSKMLNKPSHMFHILTPSLWPFFLAVGMFFFVTGMAFSMHHMSFSFKMLIMGLIMLMTTAIFWFLDISSEAVMDGYHTSMVSNGLMLGFLFFMASEMMLFFGFFWAFFHSALSPAMELGSIWPPKGLKYMKISDFPLYNTFLLMFSGFSVTWAHRGISMGSFKNALDGLLLTIFLGFFFLILQGMEYFESTFNLQDGTYSSVFFLLTGLHGCHVIVGVIFLFFCFLSLINNHFLSDHYLSFVCAVWYWHFVDMVWMLLFLTLYCWGSW